MRPFSRSTSKPANSGTTARPCMAMPRLERIMVDRRLALPSSESWAPSTFSKCSSSSWNSFTISTARPAVPAMPTAEYSSAGNTFSMSRCAIMFPIVARRSPASTTPPGNDTATIVVPCGASMTPWTGGSCRLPGSISGWWSDRKSMKDDDPGVRKAAGRRPVLRVLASTRFLPGMSAARLMTSGSIPELPEGRIAVEAQYASDPTRLVAVIHMHGRSSKTDAADAPLCRDHLVPLGFA